MNDAICRIERGPYGAQFTLAVPDDSQEIHYQLETLITSRPKALLPAFRQIGASGARFAYPITGLASLSELAVKKRLNRKQASSIVRQIRELTLDLPDHLLSPEQVLLHPDCLFIRQPCWDIQVVYQPFLPLLEPFGEQELLDWLAKSAIRIPCLRHPWKKAQLQDSVMATKIPVPEPPSSHKSDEQEEKPAMSHSRTVSFGLAIIQLLVMIMTLLTLWQPSGWSLTMGAIHRPLLAFFVLTIPAQAILLIYSKSQNNGHLVSSDRPSIQAEHTDTGTIFTALGARVKTLATSLNPIQVLKNIRASIKERAEKSEASLGRVREMPTELLSSKQALFRLATLSEGMIGTAEETAGQRAFILTEEFVVGRDFRLVDLCLTGYAVGRRHARISRKGATFFITDLGSKNGTRLNGELLNKMVEYRLPDRCQIQFADRPFYFEAEELLESLSDQSAC